MEHTGLLCGGKGIPVSPLASLPVLLFLGSTGWMAQLLGCAGAGKRELISINPFLTFFVCLYLCILSGRGWAHSLSCDFHNTERELRLPFMLGCSSQATWVHGEIERSRRISESKTETVFGLESPCFSEIQRESVTQDGFFKSAKH